MFPLDCRTPSHQICELQWPGHARLGISAPSGRDTPQTSNGPGHGGGNKLLGRPAGMSVWIMMWSRRSATHCNWSQSVGPTRGGSLVRVQYCHDGDQWKKCSRVQFGRSSARRAHLLSHSRFAGNMG